MNSKQRAFLRGKANSMETILQIGKQGVGVNLVRQVDEALTAREMIKMRILESAELTAQEAARLLAERCGADVVQVIGTRFVLYRANPKKPAFSAELPL